MEIFLQNLFQKHGVFIFNQNVANKIINKNDLKYVKLLVTSFLLFP